MKFEGTTEVRRAAIYARVSTAEQVDGSSLQTQVEACETYVTAQAWEIDGRYVDEGVSGAKANRPALDQLLGAVRAGRVGVVVVKKLDRIGRSMRHLSTLLGELDDRGVTLVSVSEAFDSSTPSGRLHRNMLGSFAEFEREQIRERMMSGQDAAIRAGRWTTGVPPFGYRITGSGNTHQLVIDDNEATLLRLAIHLYVDQRHTTGQVAAELNGRGLRPRRAPRWTGHNLRTQLKDAQGISGTWEWRRADRNYTNPPIPVAVPAIIDLATHDRLRARLGEDTTGHASHSDRYLLAGRLRTPHGTPMYGMTMSCSIYRCADTFPSSRAQPGPRTCNCRSLRAERTDGIVWAEVCALLADPARLLAMSGIDLARNNDTLTAGADDLNAINRRIHRLEQSAGQRLSRLLAEGLDPAVASHAARALTDELVAVRRHRDQIVAWQTVNAQRRSRSERLAELARRATQILPDADMPTKQRIVALLQVQVSVDRWEPCPACNGRGWQRRPPTRSGETSPGEVKHGRRVGTVCPTCLRHKQLPRLVIEGLVPETDLANPAIDPNIRQWPFTVVGTAG